MAPIVKTIRVEVLPEVRTREKSWSMYKGAVSAKMFTKKLATKIAAITPR